MHQSQRRNVTRSYIFSQNESYVKTMMNSDFAFIRHSTIETYTSHTILSTRSRTNSHKWNTLRVEKEYSYCLEWFLLCHDFSTNLFFFSVVGVYYVRRFNLIRYRFVWLLFNFEFMFWIGFDSFIFCGDKLCTCVLTSN